MFYQDKKLFRKLILYRFLNENVFLFLLQYVSLMFNLNAPAILPLWLATGTACGFIFLRGITILPGIFLAHVCAYICMQFNLISSLSCASLDVIQYFLIYYFCHRYVGPTLITYQVKQFIKLNIVIFPIVFMCSAFWLQIKNIFSYPTWLQWSLMNINSIFILAAAILTWDYYFSALDTLSQYHKKIFISLLSTITVMTALLLFNTQAITQCLLMITIFSFTLNLAYQFPWSGAVAGVFSSTLVLALGAYLQVPLFNRLPQIQFIFLQIILLVLSLIPLFLSTFLTARWYAKDLHSLKVQRESCYN